MCRKALSKGLLALSCVVLLAPSVARAGPRTLSLQMQDADIRHVLRLIAEVSQLNFVVADEVQGKLTLRLRNVAWTDALKVVLQSKGLGLEREGNIVRIAPLTRFQDEALLRAGIKRAELAAKPLRTRIIQVSYARAEDLAPQVKATLTERGSVTVDSRTNSLIIRDVE
jgi:type IV pilus assembly protein PilQ